MTNIRTTLKAARVAMNNDGWGVAASAPAQDVAVHITSGGLLKGHHCVSLGCISAYVPDAEMEKFFTAVRGAGPNANDAELGAALRKVFITHPQWVADAFSWPIHGDEWKRCAEIYQHQSAPPRKTFQFRDADGKLITFTATEVTEVK